MDWLLPLVLARDLVKTNNTQFKRNLGQPFQTMTNTGKCLMEIKKIEDFLQSRNEFELPISDSNYDQDYPIEENLLNEEVKSP